MLHVKTGDTVLVLAGKSKKKTGKVISASPKDNTVIVEGVNIITKHRKPKNQNDKGGIEKIAGPIDVSNVQLICPKCGKATRVNHIEVEGAKVRVCKKCGAKIETKFEKKSNKAKKEENSLKKEKATKKTVVKSKKATKETLEEESK